MWHPNPVVARMHEDAQLRTLYACFGVSIALHSLAMLAFPGLRSDDQRIESPALTAMFASRSRAESIASASPRERRVTGPSVPLASPVDPVPMAKAEEPAPAVAPVEPAAAAPPASAAAVPAPVEASARPQTAALDANLHEAYRRALIAEMSRDLRYPPKARERGWEGRVEIRVVIGENGVIKSALVKNSSRYSILDDQALDMLRRAAKTQPAPHGREFTVDIPVIFELRG